MDPLVFARLAHEAPFHDAGHGYELRSWGDSRFPGADTLPLSRTIAESGRLDVPVPGPFLAPLYGLRRWAAGFEFRYDLNLRRFHCGGVIDGTRARHLLGYVPGHPVQWPRAWWRLLVERLAKLRSERT